MLTPETKEGSRPRTPGGRALLLVAAVAVLIGFAGSATAAVIVTGKQIKDNTITTKDLADASLGGIDVKDESLTQADFDTPVIGPRGFKGPQGPVGADGSAGLVYAVQAFDIPKNADRTWGASCPQGTRVISGGGSNTDVAEITESAPTDDAGSGWWVGMRNETNKTITGYAWALCVTAS